MTDPGEWVRKEVARLASLYFPGREDPLEKALTEMARRHEKQWRASAAGVFRPTPSMYLVALQWELKRHGPTCAVCRGDIAIPKAPEPPRPEALTMSMSPRVHPREGGLNVPQNLQLGHAGCMPRW